MIIFKDSITKVIETVIKNNPDKYDAEIARILITKIKEFKHCSLDAIYKVVRYFRIKNKK